MEETCRTCLFYKGDVSDPWRDECGKCRRFPEHLDTKEDSWCGEYKHRSRRAT